MEDPSPTDAIKEVIAKQDDLDLERAIDHCLSESWDLLRENERTRHGFRERHRREWGEALDLLGRMHFLSLELGRRFNGRYRDEEAQGPNAELFDALTRLHGRMCLVSMEVYTLLESGHASGAQSRWRTLYETLVVMVFIAVSGNETARRYLLHEAMKSKEAMDQYREYRDRLNLEPIEEDVGESMEDTYDELKGRFGGVFATDYGWAAKALEDHGKDHGGRPRLEQMAEIVGMDHLRPYYTLANHSIHAGSKAIAFDLGVMDGADLILSGPSNYGLADPGGCTAIALQHSLRPLIVYAQNRISDEEKAADALVSEVVELVVASEALDKLSEACQDEFKRVQDEIREREKELRDKDD